MKYKGAVSDAVGNHVCLFMFVFLADIFGQQRLFHLRTKQTMPERSVTPAFSLPGETLSYFHLLTVFRA